MLSSSELQGAGRGLIRWARHSMPSRVEFDVFRGHQTSGEEAGSNARCPGGRSCQSDNLSVEPGEQVAHIFAVRIGPDIPMATMVAPGCPVHAFHRFGPVATQRPQARYLTLSRTTARRRCRGSRCAVWNYQPPRATRVAASMRQKSACLATTAINATNCGKFEY